MVNTRRRRKNLTWNVSKVMLFLVCALSLILIHRSYSQPQSRTAPVSTLEQSLCQDIHHVQKQCEFYRKYCNAEDDGIFSSLDLYYCRLAGAKPLAMIIILGWLAILFITLGSVAGDFFSVNLSSIARILHMSDTLAGTTFLALGNGSPDIFSTFAAMKSDSSGLAIGELIGAAAFITTVVAGSMALVGPFDVVRASLLRDGVFLMAAVAFLIYIMADGYLRLWHCVVMLTLYVVYVSFVMGWHWWLAHPSKKRKHAKEANLQDVENAAQAPTEATSLLPDACPEEPSDESSTHTRETAAPERGHVHATDQVHDAVDTMPNTVSKTTAESTLGKIAKALLPFLYDLDKKNACRIMTSVVSAPSILALKLTVPVVDHRSGADTANRDDPPPEDWRRWLLIMQGFFAPQLAQLMVWRQTSATPAAIVLPSLICLGISSAFGILVLLTSSQHQKPRWFNLLTIPGFIMSILWISAVADEVVGVLKSLGVICNISEGLLGLTVFAIGNSLDDLVANISVAQHKHPVMALSACYGGPLLNILIGISVSGIFMFSKGLHTKHKLTTVVLQVDRSLFVEAGGVLVALITVLCAMLWTRWRFTKAIGFVLIALWVIGTIANVTLKVA